MNSPLSSALLIVSMVASATIAAELSPTGWPKAERERVEALELQPPWPRVSKVVEAKSGLVAATMSPIAIQAGIQALQHGGTAADAAATVALTQVTTALGSYVSYAGVLQLLYYDAKTSKVYAMSTPLGFL